MPDSDGQELLYRTVSAAAAPASGVTATLWASNQNVAGNEQRGARYKLLIINVYSSHASAASGLVVEESADGVSWRTNTAWSVSATTVTKKFCVVGAPYVRVRYIQSANTVSTWEISILGDQNDRATGTTSS